MIQVSKDEIDRLKSELKGQLLTPSAEKFAKYVTLFNASCSSKAHIIVRPRDAEDVSKTVIFCNRHALTLSVKAGGYGVHGWGVSGDVVIDLALLNGTGIALPNANETYTTLATDKYTGTSLKDRSSSNASSSSSSYHPSQPLKKRSADRAFNYRSSHPLQHLNTNDSNGSASTSRSRSSRDEGSGSGSGSDKGKGSMVRDDTGWDESSGSINGWRQNERGEGPFSMQRLRSDEGLSDGSNNSNTHSHPHNDIPSPNSPPSTSYLSNATIPSSSSSGANTLQSFLPATTWTNPNFDSALPSFRPTYAIPPPPPPGSGFDPSHSGLAASPLSFGQTFSSLIDPNAVSAFTYSPVVPHSFSTSSSSRSSAHPNIHYRNSTASSTSTSSFHNLYPAVQSPLSSPTGQPFAPYAYATFGAGAHTKEVDRYTSSSSFGPYHVPFAAFPVGLAVMISGGFGFLSREHGLSMDALVEAEVVMADGTIKVVSAESDPELWWGLRGFGPSLAICTRYTALAYPVPVVFAGNIIYPFNRSSAPSLLMHFRNVFTDAPVKLYANCIFTAGPGNDAKTEDMVEGKGKGNKGTGGGAVVVVQLCWNGTQELGMEWVRKMCDWEGEKCLFKDVEERSFLEQQDSVANVLRGGAGRKWFIKGELLETLSDTVIHETVRLFSDIPDGCSWLFELSGGKLEENTTTCLPASHRAAKFNLLALHQWPLDETAEEDERCVQTAEKWIDHVIHPESPGGPLPCFLNQNTPQSYVASSFGPSNWARLQALKKRVDPHNVLRFSLGGGTDQTLSDGLTVGKESKGVIVDGYSDVDRARQGKGRGMAAGPRAAGGKTGNAKENGNGVMNGGEGQMQR